MPPQDSNMISDFNFNLCDCGSVFAPQTGKYQIARVKFGVSLGEVCKNDIPGPLLILILKLNKEGPYRKDVFRAPGHHGNMKKLIHFLHSGRLVNIDHYSVYTIASVLKKFLRKLPGGIFGVEGEQELFRVIEMTNVEEQRDLVHLLFSTLPTCTQRLIVLLFGTFRVIASNSERMSTGMTAEALGVSVAPSFFQSCVSDGKTAKMEDVKRFKVATKIMKFLIENFGVTNLYGRNNYEYYARITGRILKIEEDWIFSFRYPPDSVVSRQISLWAEKTWLEDESSRWGLRINLKAMSQQEESQSTPALIETGDRLETVELGEASSSLTIIPENTLLENYARLNLTPEECLFQDSSFRHQTASRSSSNLHMSLDELKAINHYAESTKSLTFLPQVHERQTARLKARSDWFLSPSPVPFASPDRRHFERSGVGGGSGHILREDANRKSAKGGFGGILSASAESLKQLVRRTSSKEKDGSRRLVRRTSSKKNKENGNVGAGNNNSSSTNLNITSNGGGKCKAASTPITSSSQHREPQQPPSSILVLPPSPQVSVNSSNSNQHSNLSATAIDALSTVVNVSEGDSASDFGSTTARAELSDPPKLQKKPRKLDFDSAVAQEDDIIPADDVIPVPGATGHKDGRPVDELIKDAIAGASSSTPATAPTSITAKDCTETNVQTFHVTLTYKPRI